MPPSRGDQDPIALKGAWEAPQGRAPPYLGEHNHPDCMEFCIPVVVAIFEIPTTPTLILPKRRPFAPLSSKSFQELLIPGVVTIFDTSSFCTSGPWRCRHPQARVAVNEPGTTTAEDPHYIGPDTPQTR